MATNTLAYKGFTGTVEIDMDDGICVGKLLFIDDLVMYESETPRGLQEAFEEAVDDYLATCAEIGKEPQRPCSGTFNVRVDPSIHRQAVVHARSTGVTLNEVVVRAMDCYLNNRIDVAHHVTVTLEQGQLQTVQALASGEPGWSYTHVKH